MNGSFKELKVYQLAFNTAMQIFKLSSSFPKSETYSLTDQIRRSSRSVAANIAEAYRKRIYPKHFVMKLSDADAEASETMVWIDFARSCNYITNEVQFTLTEKYAEVGRMLGGMMKHPEKFIPQN